MDLTIHLVRKLERVILLPAGKVSTADEVSDVVSLSTTIACSSTELLASLSKKPAGILYTQNIP